MIDHMHYQNDHTQAGEWLFGTTRSNDLTHKGDYVHVWRLDLDSDHNPRSDNLQVKQLDAGGLSDDSHVTGVRPKMSGDVISMIIWVADTEELRYF